MPLIGDTRVSISHPEDWSSDAPIADITMSTQKKSHLRVTVDAEFLQRFHSCALLHARSVKDAVREALELWMDFQEESASVSGAHPVHKIREGSTRPPKKGV